MPLILVGGGARSGKSRQAENIARSKGSRRAYIATAQAFDDEMTARIARHQADRAGEFVTVEEPFELARAVQECEGKFDVVLVDCLTLWLSNLMLADHESLPDLCRKTATVMASASMPVVAVTNEVGMGIVPDNELARRFRDESGRMNQLMAEAATEVYWSIFGISLRMK